MVSRAKAIRSGAWSHENRSKSTDPSWSVHSIRVRIHRIRAKKTPEIALFRAFPAIQGERQQPFPIYRIKRTISQHYRSFYLIDG